MSIKKRRCGGEGSDSIEHLMKYPTGYEPRTHKMTLLRPYFESIARGEKTVEMRLNDEKRKQVKVGDLIEFTCADSTETVTVAVQNKRVFADFSRLAEAYPPKVLGFSHSPACEIAEFMTSVYGKEAIEKNNALAIEIRLLSDK